VGGGSGVHIRIGLAGNIHRVSLHGERVDKVLPEAHELSSHIRLARGRDRAGRKARTNGLLNPDHVGQVVPTPWVREGQIRAVLPQERAILLEEALEGRTAGLFSSSVISSLLGIQSLTDQGLTPPFSQMTISLLEAGFGDGWNQKYSWSGPSRSLVMDMRPA